MKDFVLKAVLTLKDEMTARVRAVQSTVAVFAKGVFSNLMNIKAGFDMAKAATERLWAAFQEGVKVEKMTRQFKFLIGSMAEAQKHMKDLIELGSTPPFSRDEFAAASRELMVMSGGILGFKNNLILVGDAAAKTGRPLEQVAFAIGRSYAIIRDGGELGRATMELRNLGVITPGVILQLERMKAAGETNIAIWRSLESAMRSHNGAMADTEQTTAGKMGSLGATWEEAKTQFSSGFLGEAKGGIDNLNQSLREMVEDNFFGKLSGQIAGVTAAFIDLFKAAGNGAETNFGSTVPLFERMMSYFGGSKKPKAFVFDAGTNVGSEARDAAAAAAAEAANIKKAAEAAEEAKRRAALDADMAKAQGLTNAQAVADETAKLDADLLKNREEIEGIYRDIAFENAAKIEEDRKRRDKEVVEERFRLEERAAERQMDLNRDLAQKEIKTAQAVADAKVAMAERAKKGTLEGNVGDLQKARDQKIQNAKDDEAYARRMEKMAKLKSLSPKQRQELEDFQNQQALRNKGNPGGAQLDQIKAVEKQIKLAEDQLAETKDMHRKVLDAMKVN